MIINKDLSIIILEEKHIQNLRKARNMRAIWHYLSNSFLINEIQQIEWFKKQSLDNTKQYFVILVKDEFAGCIWYEEWDKINRQCRIGLFIHPKFQRKNIGYKISKLFLNYLFNDLNLHRIWLLCLESNKKAIKLWEKLGFKEEGIQKEAIWRDGKYHNYIMMGLLEKEKNVS